MSTVQPNSLFKNSMYDWHSQCQLHFYLVVCPVHVYLILDRQ